jgi:hypothetical protein
MRNSCIIVLVSIVFASSIMAVGQGSDGAKLEPEFRQLPRLSDVPLSGDWIFVGAGIPETRFKSNSRVHSAWCTGRRPIPPWWAFLMDSLASASQARTQMETANGKSRPTPDGRPVVRPRGQPAILGEKGGADVLLRPITDDWQAPDLHNPHRIRVLFKTKAVPGA